MNFLRSDHSNWQNWGYESIDGMMFIDAAKDQLYLIWSDGDFAEVNIAADWLNYSAQLFIVE